jgi:hypothetical protein
MASTSEELARLLVKIPLPASLTPGAGKGVTLAAAALLLLDILAMPFMGALGMSLTLVHAGGAGVLALLVTVALIALHWSARAQVRGLGQLGCVVLLALIWLHFLFNNTPFVSLGVGFYVMLLGVVGAGMGALAQLREGE